MKGRLSPNSFLLAGLPAVLGLGFAWMGVRIMRNETRLLVRQLELEEAFRAKCRKERRKFLLGN